MTAMRLNTDIYRSLGIISEDEGTLPKAAKYLSRVAKQMTDDPTCMTEEEYFAMLDKSREQAARGEVYRFDNKEKMLDWLNAL